MIKKFFTDANRSSFLELRALVFAGLVLSLLSYATSIMLANTLGPENFGQYTYALVLGTLLGQIVAFGTAEAGVTLKTKYGDKALDWILTTKFVNFVILSIGAFIAFWLSGAMISLFVLIIASNSLSFSTHYETSEQNIRYASIYLVERAIITLQTWVVIFFAERHILLWVFANVAIVQLASLIYQYIDRRVHNIHLNWWGLFKVYNEGLFVLVFSMSKFSFGGITRIIIFYRLGDGYLGLFAAAWQFVPLCTLYFAQTTKTWRLRINESLRARDAFAFSRNLKGLAFFVMVPALVGAVTFSVFGTRIIEFILSDQFKDAAPLMPYVGAYFVIVGFDSIVLLLAIAMGRSTLAGVVYLFFGGVTFIASCLLPSEYGLEGFLMLIVLGHLGAAVALSVNLLNSIRNYFL